jgi:Fe2+ or Zn2+ uptake regulation protein
MTKNRKLILNVIKNSQGHLTADEIFAAARAENPSIAKGTIYRNLGLMVDEGLLRRVTVIGSPDRYDDRTEVHQHMICARCGAIRDVRFDTLKEKIEQSLGTEILSFEMQINYICPECRARGEK